MTQQWTDGVAVVAQDGQTVTVQILGDVWVQECADPDEAALVYAAEVATEEERAAAWANRERWQRDWDRYADVADWWVEVLA